MINNIPEILSKFILILGIHAIIISGELCALLVLKKKKIETKKNYTFFIMAFILAVQLVYIYYTPFYERQHDGRSFGNYENGGHFGYMGYIFYNNHLPVGSPKDYWCFFNPPLFYIISVFFIKIQNVLGIALETCLENLQILSVLYTIVFDIYVYRIMKEMDIKKSILYILSFVGLAPAMIIMSGSLNNDILSIMLSTMAVFYTIKWYKDDNLKNLIKIAITISLAMMTKISSALIAVAIACVFVHKVIVNKKELKRYIGNFAIFALIALPIGLWYPVKNLVLYQVPITYVQSVDADHEANVSDFSAIDRILNIAQKENIRNKNIIMTGENRDNNILITTVKSFLFDEQINYEDNFILKFAITLGFYCTLIILFLFLINLIFILKNYKKVNNKWISYFVLILFLQIFSYIKFCFDYPFVFTMNFRYIVPTLISYSVITGLACEHSKKLYYINNVCLGVFLVLSIMICINLI